MTDVGIGRFVYHLYFSNGEAGGCGSGGDGGYNSDGE